MADLPQVLTKEMKEQISDLVLGGLNPETDAEEISEALGMPLDHMKRLFMQERQDLLLRKAELTSKELLEINLDQENLEAKFGPRKIALLKLKQAEAQFIRESLGKDIGYSKRTELTGAGGGAVVVKSIVFHAPVMPGDNPRKPINETAKVISS